VRVRRVIVVALVVIILVAGGLAFSAYGPFREGRGCSGACLSTSESTASTLSSSVSTASTETTASQSTSRGGWLSDDPSFVNGSSKIDYPPDYAGLANFTLGLINTYRASAGVAAVALSTVPSGQQHADSMAYYGTIGHWDVQGYKPYMRYTLLGGTGYVGDTVAWGTCTDSVASAVEAEPSGCTTQTIEDGIANSEYSMMNHDGACCDNGSRYNILGVLHDRVSIGIAYNSTSDSLYLVEDFEDDYIGSGSLQLSGSNVTFSGSTGQNLTGWIDGSPGAQLSVYYDPMPSPVPSSGMSPLTASCGQYSELDEPAQCKYWGRYGAGTEVTNVLAPCPQGSTCDSGNVTYAQTWQQGAGKFQIVFSIAALESAYGDGVYTLYLWPAGDTVEPITSWSVFVTNASS
jgi:hypothetical protein